MPASGATSPRSPPLEDLPPSQHDYDTAHDQTSENTPLLSRENNDRNDEGEPVTTPQSPAASSLLRSIESPASGKRSYLRRWPTMLALSMLCVLIVVILILGFITPEAVNEYTQEALIFEPTSLSIDSFTKTGIVARIQGDFMMDASRVKKKSVRDLGRFGTSLVRKVESGKTDVEVILPEYGNLLLGSATVPPIVVDVRNGHESHIDFLSEVEPGSFDGLRRVASDGIDGRLGELRVKGNAEVPIKSGLISFGKHKFTHSLTFKGLSSAFQ